MNEKELQKPELGVVPEHLSDAMERVATADQEDLVGMEVDPLTGVEHRTEVESRNAEQIDQAREYVQDVIEKHKQSSPQSAQPLDDDQDDQPPSPKIGRDWFLDIPEPDRVRVATEFITTKKKSLVDVVEAFVYHQSYAQLDDLERELSRSYDELVEKGILEKLDA